MAQKTRSRTLKPGAKFRDENGERHVGPAEVPLTLAQEWHFRDQLAPSGPLDPTHEPTAAEIKANEGRETIRVAPPAPAGQAPATPPAAAPPAPPPASQQAAPQQPVPAAPGTAAPPQGDGQGTPAPEPDESGGHAIHDLNVAEAQALVASAGNLQALQGLEDAELRHPRHEGGRSGVKRAIDARRAELAA